jgi:hypothetical protein
MTVFPSAIRRIAAGLIGALAIMASSPALAQPGQAYGPKDDSAESGFDGEVSLLATYAKRARELASDYDRSGLGASATLGYEVPAGTTTFRLEAHVETDKYTTSYRGEAEVRQQLGEAVTVSLSASGTKHAIVLESLDADQVAVRAGIKIVAGQTAIEAFGRHRWRTYNDLTLGEGKGWQGGGKVRQRFGPYHWLEIGGNVERIDDGGGRHGFRRTTLAIDYSHPIARRLRVLVGLDHRAWTYDGRWIADNSANPRRHDRLTRPELGLSWGKTRGAYVRATAGYDFYRSNDPRWSGDGPRLRLVTGYRF